MAKPDPDTIKICRPHLRDARKSGRRKEVAMCGIYDKALQSMEAHHPAPIVERGDARCRWQVGAGDLHCYAKLAL